MARAIAPANQLWGATCSRIRRKTMARPRNLQPGLDRTSVTLRWRNPPMSAMGGKWTLGAAPTPLSPEIVTNAGYSTLPAAGVSMKLVGILTFVALAVLAMRGARWAYG